MNQFNDNLKYILQDLMSEKKKLQNMIQNNLDKAEELENYKKSIDIQDDNYKIFSPRTENSICQLEIEKSDCERLNCDKDNQDIYVKINFLNSYIDRIKNILEKEDDRALDSIRQRDKNLAVLNIQEEERQRIARDLHDTSLQNLAHLVHKVELSTLFINQDPVRAKLELAVVSKGLKSVIEEIRNTIFDLRPMSFDDLGWKDTLERLLDKVNEGQRYDIVKEIEDITCENNLILVSLYRVVRECVSNAVKYSEGNKLYFSCKMEDYNCVIDIEDNGKGFTLEEVEQKREKHFGLSVVKERIELMGGSLEISSLINQGTKIIIKVPLL